ncbi:ankyrin repeat domain-containing protein 65-like, partial [Sitodiplosis mosellana]|uniref:ankyrin repeat domain-containing protein 65-like n=1 Tax=Sitodiplosis mosellana TaxID=263140 RepID=UPI0024440E20
HKNVVDELIKNGANLNNKDIHGRTPLEESIYEEHDDIAEELINRGSDLTSKDQYGDTPLHLAAMYGNLKIVQLLVEKGASLTARDNRPNRRTPYESACAFGGEDHKKVAAYLETKL